MKNPYQAVVDFEEAVAEYCGAPYFVAVSSCTAALHLCCEYLQVGEVEIPRFSYLSVPMSILHAGGTVKFRDEDWVGDYVLEPYRIIDSARLFTSNMYEAGTYRCVSFHASKTLGIEAGGGVLTDDPEADTWIRKARHDGRTPGVAANADNPILGWHYLLNPSTAAQGALKLYSLPAHNSPIPNDPYPDLSKMSIFR